MFKVGDRVRVKIDADDLSIDYKSDLRGEVFTVQSVVHTSVLLLEVCWWVLPSALELESVIPLTKEEGILKKIAHLYKLFDERKK
jgi:hypothetical protein